MRNQVVTVGPLAAASANNIALSQSAAGAQALTLNGTLVSGGVATLDKPRRVLITSGGNDSTITFTISGTNWSGALVNETLTGGNVAAVYSVLDYAKVTSIVTSGATASTVTVGTNGVASSEWVREDEWANWTGNLSVIISGTLNYSVESTLDDPNVVSNPLAPSAMTWFGLTGATSQSASATWPINNIPTFWRITINSGSGSARGTFQQFGSVTY